MDEFHKAFAGLFDQIQYMFKPLFTTIVGVWYYRGLRCLQKFSQPPNLVKMLCWVAFNTPPPAG